MGVVVFTSEDFKPLLPQVAYLHSESKPVELRSGNSKSQFVVIESSDSREGIG